MATPRTTTAEIPIDANTRTVQIPIVVTPTMASPTSTFTTFPSKILSFFQTSTNIIVVAIIVLVASAALTARGKVLTIIDEIDKELYTIEDTTFEGTLRVTKGVTIGTSLPIGDIAQKINSLPDSIPISTNIPLSTNLDFNTRVPLNTTLTIDTLSTSSIELPPLGSLQSFSIPIHAIEPINTTLPLITTVPLNTQLPLSFSVPIDNSLSDVFAQDLSLETTIPIHSEIPMSLDISETNLSPRFAQWHTILNSIRTLLLAPEKTRADLQ